MNREEVSNDEAHENMVTVAHAWELRSRERGYFLLTPRVVTVDS